MSRGAGARPLVDFESEDKLEVVVQEILQDKIFLDSNNDLKTAPDQVDLGGPPELDLSAM